MLAPSQFTVLAVFVYADIATLAFNSNTERAKAGGSSRVQGQPGLRGEFQVSQNSLGKTLSQNK